MGALRDFPTDTLGHIVPTLIALSSSSLFVVSGAGLPIPIIPATDSIAQLCIAAYHQIGAYPARQAPWTEFRKRLLAPLLSPPANYTVRTERWRDHMLGGVYDAALIALFQRQIHRRFEPVVPANYHVFYYVPPPAVLFDFNSDALLPYYCEPPHLVLNPHGVIDRRVLEHPDFEQSLRDAAIFGMPLPTSTWQWLPGPEPTVITRRPEYKMAERYFDVPGEFFLLIGYSFGRQRNGAIDDAESFEFLRELLRRFPRSVVVVDPNLGSGGQPVRGCAPLADLRM
jgi:hypothetical protein